MLRSSIIFLTLASLFHFSFVKSDQRSARVRRIVGGSPADLPPIDDPVVYTRFHERAARVQGVREFPHYVFKGIRFAYPPTGRDRFVRPREKFLEGDVNATVFAPPCVQPVAGRDMVIGDEDCLALNIFTPDLPTGTEGLPVVVWIHGGGFRYGSASQYGVRHLVGKRLTVVTIQYRLGSLGFLSSGTKDLPGNAGLWDMALAVQWVRNYIGFFGGNPHRIVVMGHGTGASSALLVALSNIAKGMPSGVVAMSGTAVSQWATDNTPTKTAQDVAQHNGCPVKSALTMVRCLQNLPPDSIIKTDSDVEFQRIRSQGFVSGLNGRLGAAPVAEGFNDGRCLPGIVEDDPVNDMYKEKNPKVPLLTGVTKDETKKAVKGHFSADIIHQLTTIPNFLDKVLVKNLQGSLNTHMNKLIGLQSNMTSALTGALPLNFGNYLQTKQNNVQEGLDKVSEATADALFNVPAFLTASLWKDAPTFLYSFEHTGKMKKGYSFLKGFPLVGNKSVEDTDDLKDTVGHGDELAYLFDAHDLEGKPLESDTPTEDDEKVREFFTQMIADFARHGSLTVDNKKVSPFSATDNNFIQIKPKPVLANSFRYCEMALWVNIAERLKSTSCQFLKAFDTSMVPQTLFTSLNQAKSPVGVLQGGMGNVMPNTNLIGGGGGSGSNSGKNSNKMTNPIGTMTNKVKLPFGGFG